MAVCRTFVISLATHVLFIPLVLFALFIPVTQSSARVEQKEYTNIGPWRQLPAINYCDPVQKCPVTSSRKGLRKLCIGWVNQDDFDGLAYHCQINADYNVTLEFPYQRFKCPKGMYGLVEFNNQTNSVRILCKNCSYGYFQTDEHHSPENLKGCTYRRRSHDPTKVKCDPTPGPSEPQRCYCNYLDNWFSKSGQLYCGFTHSCDCINIFRCDTHKKDLLPDGRCYSRCEGVRRSDRNFDCIILETQGNIITRTVAQVVTLTPVEQDTDSLSERNSSKEYQTTHRTHRQATSSDDEHTKTIKIVLALVVVLIISVIIAIIVIVVYFKMKRSSISYHRNSKKAGRDLYNINHADHVTVKYSSSSSASNESVTEESITSEEKKEVIVFLRGESGREETHILKKS